MTIQSIDSLREAVKEQVNIVDYISQFTVLKKSGQSYMGKCPFHEERTPSFSVSEQKQLFHCFSCGRGGDLVHFVQENEQVDYVEALKHLALYAHLDLSDSLDVGKKTSTNPLTPLYQLYDQAKKLFQHLLMHTQTGHVAKDYLKKRGIDEETINHFQLGYIPNEKDLLAQYFLAEGMDSDFLAKSGLFHIDDASQTLRDRFTNRLMIPLNNHNGQTIAFSGRLIALPEDQVDKASGPHQAKYINSPETDIFHKSQLLFNFDQAKREIRRADQVILCEGYMDVIRLWQAGIQPVVASMGTSLTREQIASLRPLCSQIVLCYDGDTAGLKATYRAMKAIESLNHFKVSVVPFLSGEDPDEFISQHGSQAFNQLLEDQQESAFQFKKRYFKQGGALDNEQDRLAYIDQLLAEVAEEPSLVLRELHLQDLEQETGVARDILKYQLGQKLPTNSPPKPSVASELGRQPSPLHYHKTPHLAKSLRRLSEQHLLYRLIYQPEAWTYFHPYQTSFAFADADHQQLYYLLEADYQANPDRFQGEAFVHTLIDHDLQEKFAEIAMLTLPENVSAKEIEDLVHTCQKEELKEQVEGLKLKLNEAKQKKNMTEQTRLTLELIARLKQMKE